MTTASEITATRLPWAVIINPDWYDEDEGDAGYSWTGEAEDCADAINQALAACWADNDREDDEGRPEVPPVYRPREHMQDGFTIYQAEPDFRALAVKVAKARRTADEDQLRHALDVLERATSFVD